MNALRERRIRTAELFETAGFPDQAGQSYNTAGLIAFLTELRKHLRGPLMLI
ncbi:hypothetical protein [Dactylosporangium darangshiense]|uniref:Uncharacterized protein n=1 Tax=Dactylosporangium darangshiense TaxID=579108 RepID=A0ABP8DUA5_9ACTN